MPFHFVLFSLGPGCISQTGRWWVREDHPSHHLRAVTFYLLSSICSNYTETSLSTWFFLSPSQTYFTTIVLIKKKCAKHSSEHSKSTLYKKATSQRCCETAWHRSPDTWSVCLLPLCPPTGCTSSCYCHIPACPYHHYLNGMLLDLGLIWHLCFLYLPEGAGSGIPFPQHLMLIFQ